MFLNFNKKHKNMDKTIKLQMFPVTTFSPFTRKEYLTQITKNKNLPFAKTETGVYWMYRSKTAKRNLPTRNKSY